MILFSLCIPTYNHASLLRQAVEHCLALPSFNTDPEVEIVISDNASTDDTQSVGESLAACSNGRVRYFRNETNVFDVNFALALQRGHGVYRKLANDTLLFTDEGLRKMLDLVRQYQIMRPVLFFDNRQYEKEQVLCETFDDFFGVVSFWSTWIGNFGIWADDLAKICDFSRMTDLQLTQVDVLCRMLKQKKRAVIGCFHFTDQLKRKSVGGYNLAKVFGKNYFSILSPYVYSGDMSQSAFRREKYQMLRRHLLPYYLTLGAWNAFPKTGYVRYLFRDCWTIPLFWCAIPFVCLVAAIAILRDFRKCIVR